MGGLSESVIIEHNRNAIKIRIIFPINLTHIVEVKIKSNLLQTTGR